MEEAETDKLSAEQKGEEHGLLENIECNTTLSLLATLGNPKYV